MLVSVTGCSTTIVNEDNIYKEQKEISIELGNRFYRVKSTFWVNGKIAVGLPVAVGLTTHDEKAIVTQNEQNGWEKAGIITTAEKWLNYLDAHFQQLENIK